MVVGAKPVVRDLLWCNPAPYQLVGDDADEVKSVVGSANAVRVPAPEVSQVQFSIIAHMGKMALTDSGSDVRTDRVRPVEVGADNVPNCSSHDGVRTAVVTGMTGKRRSTRMDGHQSIGYRAVQRDDRAVSGEDHRCAGVRHDHAICLRRGDAVTAVRQGIAWIKDHLKPLLTRS